MHFYPKIYMQTFYIKNDIGGHNASVNIVCVCVCVCVCVYIYIYIRGLLEKYLTVFFYAHT